MARIVTSIALLVACAVGILSIFWHQEMQYSLPTPKPKNFKDVALFSTLKLEKEKLKGPLFMHFYNPDCPCSRFNANHVKQLIHNHGDRIRFVIIVPSTNDIQMAKTKFGESLTYIVDKDKVIAVACGIYSTPQAVILTQDNVLYFRGNYNKSRYCTSQASNYAELALLSFIHNAQPPVFDVAASLSYGCELSDQTNSLAEIF
jgi:hypothetical protein